ncbi:hypothetical protein [Absidia glauca]|uniref:DH domain-containing protein n=1 Tax=Absidia glauca TaxID=4829 RepID=A0A168Q0N4_ABSGL|nr:hypothetical protein [Absidia glauca]
MTPLFSSETDKQRFLTSEKQFIDLLQLIDKNLETNKDPDFKKWRATIEELEDLHVNLYARLDPPTQDTATSDFMVKWGSSLESAYLDYTKACTLLRDQHNHSFRASVKSIIQDLPTASPYDTIDGLLAAPFDQLMLCKSIYLNLLDSSDSTMQPNLDNISRTIDTILQHPPPRMIDTDLPSFLKKVDCANVIDLVTGAPLDYQMRPMTGTIILRNDFLLTDDSNGQAPLHTHLVLTSSVLMVCKQIEESTGRYHLMYPPLALNDVLVQPLNLDRELLGEYTLQFAMLSKTLIARAESRAVRNAWTGMPSTTTAANATTAMIPLTTVVHKTSSSSSNGEINSSDENATRNHRPEFGSFYGNSDISSVDSSEEDDDDDNNSGYDIESRTTTSSITSSDNQHSLGVDKKSLPSIPTQPQPLKKDHIVPLPKDTDTPVINISLHDGATQTPTTKHVHPIKPRGSSIRAPLPNPAFQSNSSLSSVTAQKPLPRTSSMRNRPPASNVTHQNHPQQHITHQQQPSLQKSPCPEAKSSQHSQDLNPGHPSRQNVSDGSRIATSTYAQPSPPLHQQQPRTYHNRQQSDSSTASSTRSDSKPLPQTTGAMTMNAIPTHTSAQRTMPPTPPLHNKRYPTSPSNQENPSQQQDPLRTPGSRDSAGSFLRLSPEDLATPPRSPNPYSQEPNGIRQVLFSSQRCEVFRWNDPSWYAVDGQCSLEVRQTFTNRSCVAIRVQTTGELYLNAWVLPQTQVRLASPTDVSLSLIMGQQQETYLVHFGQPSEATEFDRVLQEMRQVAIHERQQQLDDGQRSVRGNSPVPQQPFADADTNSAMATTESPQGINSRRSLTRTSSLMQSGQEPTLIPQTLKPAMQCKCKLFVQKDNSNWSSFGSVQLMVSEQVPSRRMHIQIDLDDKKRGLSKIITKQTHRLSSLPPSPSPSSASLPVDDSTPEALATPTSANTLISATVYSNNVERLASKRISFLLVDQQNRTSSMVYMVQLRDDESGNVLYDYLKIKNAQNGW